MPLAPDNSTADSLTDQNFRDSFPIECARSSRLLERAAKFLTLEHLPEHARNYLQQARIVASTVGSLETEKPLAGAILGIGAKGYTDYEYTPEVTGIQATGLAAAVNTGYLRVLEDIPGKGCIVAPTDKLITHLSRFAFFQDPTAEAKAAPTPKVA